MITRRRWHISALAAAALIVAGCGGGTTDSPLVSRVVVFGDSVSDLGAYTPATQIPLAALGGATGQTAGEAPHFGGKWTTNSHTGYACQADTSAGLPGVLVRNPANNQLICNNTSNANIWVEWVAARLGVAITPAEVGFGPAANRRKCPVQFTIPALAGSCTGYAQGGSRVTNPAGIGNPNGNGIVVTNGVPGPTFMTVPMVTQVADHLAAFNGFSGDDIVFVLGGNNDVFIQFGVGGPSQPPADDPLAAVQTAATELATLVKDEIIAKGAKRVVVMTLPDFTVTPAFSGLPEQNKAFLNQLAEAFNAALLAGLSGSSARTIDLRAAGAAVLANPSAFGITNATDAACDPAKISAFTGGRITTGSAVFCNAAPAALFTAAAPAGPGLARSFNGLKTGASASTYLFADGVHPTTGGHKILGDQVWSALKDFGWVPDNL
jgi:outer membrane lipase/esterase